MELSELSNELTNLMIEIDTGIAIVRINRPDFLNALNRQLLEEIRRVIDCIGRSPAVGGMIITGAGEKAFIAGADVSEFFSLDAVSGRVFAEYGQEHICNAIENLSKPVIAAVNGYCLGGGNELAMACDIRIASTKAVFGHPELKLGLMPLYAGTKRLQRLVGFGRAKELILTARMVDADEAMNIGLVNKVVEPKKLLSAAKDMMSMILDKSPRSIHYSKMAINRVADMNIDDACEIERSLAGILFSTADKAEGVDAFINKRKPCFSDR
jgi:enoyl-CoA hydratase